MELQKGYGLGQMNQLQQGALQGKLLESAKRALGPTENKNTGAAEPMTPERIRELRNSYGHPQTPQQKELKQAAQQFEAVFVQQLLTAMDATIDRDDSLLGGGEAEKTFRGMLNQEMATEISKQKGAGFGLAESVYQQSVLMLGQGE